MNVKNIYPLSHWELQSYFRGTDLIIAGAGICGLSAALFARLRFPGKKILVVERGILPSGASTRNAGFACFGSFSEILADFKNTNEKAVQELFQKRMRGIDLLLSVAGKKSIRFLKTGGFELFDRPFGLEQKNDLKMVNSILKKISGRSQTFSISSELIPTFGLSNCEVLLQNPDEGVLDPGMLIQRLQTLVAKAGIPVLCGIEINGLETCPDGYRLLNHQEYPLVAPRVLLCTNAFTKTLLPDEDIRPGRAQVLITSPIPNLKLKGSFHYDEGFYYFRNVDNRVLLGGGRNLDFLAEETFSADTSPLIQAHLEQFLAERILHGQAYAVERRWAGTMGLGKTKDPIVQERSPGLVVCARMGGMGVAIGALAAQEAVAKIPISI